MGAWEFDGIQRKCPLMAASHALLRHNNLIYTRQREVIFQACFVEVRVVFTYPPLTALLWNHHYIDQPLEVLYLSNKTCSHKIVHLCLNNLMAIRVETSHFLSYWFSSRDNIQHVRDQHRVDYDHIRVIPGEQVYVS